MALSGFGMDILRIGSREPYCLRNKRKKPPTCGRQLESVRHERDVQ